MSSDDTDAAWYQRVVPGPIRRRFTAKFFVVVLLAMVVTAGVGAFFFTQTADTLGQQATEDVQSRADIQADALENWVRGLRSETRILSHADELQDGSVEDVSSFISSTEFRSDIVGVYYINASTMEVVTSTAGNLGGLKLTNRSTPWVSRVETLTDTATVVVSDTPYSSPGGSGEVIGFVSRVAGDSTHLVVVEASVSARQGIFRSSEQSYTTVHDPEADPGEFVYDGTGNAGIPSQLSEFESSALAEQEVYATASVPGTDWTVVSHVTKSAAFRLRDQIGTSIVALILVPLVVIGGAAAVIGRRTGQTLGRLTDRAEQVRDGDLDTTIETTRVDEIGQLTEAFDDMRVSLRERIEEAEQARKEAEVSRAEALELSNYLQEKADEYAEIMQQCGAGDLTQRMEPDGENEAMDRIAGEFNEMIDELENTTGQLKSFADEVETGGEVVQTSSESVRDASEQVADSIQRISDDAYDQKERLQEVSETMDSIAADLESFAAEHDVDFGDSLERIERMANALSEVVELSEETMAEAENVAGAAEEQAAELNEVSERANDLTRYAGPLRDVLDRFETESEHEFYFPTGPGSPPDSSGDE